jgi:hypothetical protein
MRMEKILLGKRKVMMQTGLNILWLSCYVSVCSAELPDIITVFGEQLDG